MVNVNELRAYYDADPFQPLEIVLGDGRHVIVEEREHFGWSAEARTLMFPVGPDVVDSTTFSNVVEVRPLKRGRRRAS
jgi:hypothetical protein